jgi:hypothetical protein
MEREEVKIAREIGCEDTIVTATYSYNEEAIKALESSRDIIISTLRYPEWHKFVWLDVASKVEKKNV